MSLSHCPELAGVAKQGWILKPLLGSSSTIVRYGSGATEPILASGACGLVNILPGPEKGATTLQTQCSYQLGAHNFGYARREDIERRSSHSAQD